MSERSQLRSACRVPPGALASEVCPVGSAGERTDRGYEDLSRDDALAAIQAGFDAQARGQNYQDAWRRSADAAVRRTRARRADQENEMYDDDDDDCACQRGDADQPRDERGRFAASQSGAASEATEKANAKGSRAAHHNAVAAHQSAAAAHARAANDFPGNSPEHAEHMATANEHLKSASVHARAVRESKSAAKVASADKPTTATPLNVSALADHVAQHGGHAEFTNKVEATSVSHIQRTVKAGLVEHASSSTLKLTPAGHEAVLGHLKKEATRLTHPAYNSPADHAKRERIATAITNLSANPPKLDADDYVDDNAYGRARLRADARAMFAQPGANGRVIECPAPRTDNRDYGTSERAAAEAMRRASENAWKGK